MLPGQASRIEAVEIGLGDEALSEKVVVLLGAGNRAQDVEGGPGRRHLAQHIQMFLHSLLGVLRKSDDVGEMRAESMLATEAYNLEVRFRTVLPLVRREEGLAI